MCCAGGMGAKFGNRSKNAIGKICHPKLWVIPATTILAYRKHELPPPLPEKGPASPSSSEGPEREATGP